MNRLRRTSDGRRHLGERLANFQSHGIASDGAGNLFVADSGNGTIRKVVIATGKVTTFYGQPSYSYSGSITNPGSPTGVASDGAGNLYVSDTGDDPQDGHHSRGIAGELGHGRRQGDCRAAQLVVCRNSIASARSHITRPRGSRS